jgi:hypothetical protein
MWLLLAIVLSAVLLFYWFALMGTIWFWANGIFSLCKGHFTRATIWLSLGYGMLLWWRGTEVIPHPWDFDAWLRGSAVFVGVGALATFVRWRKKQQAMKAIPTMPMWTMPADAAGNIAPVIEVEYKRLPN